MAQLADAIIPRYRPFILLGGYGGLRPDEALRAEWRDLDVGGRRLAVRGTKTRGARRTIRLPAFVVTALTEHRHTFPHVRLILHNQAGNLVSERNLRRRQFARAVAASVGELVRPYDLRHTHVALLVAEGMHPKGISDRLGHTSIRTTMDTYGHLFEAAESDVVDRLGTQVVPNEEEPPSMESGSGL